MGIVGTLTEQECQRGALSRREPHGGPQHAARIEPRACLLAEPDSGDQRRGPMQAAIAAEKLTAICAPVALFPRHIDESYTLSELGIPWVVGEQCAGLCVELRDDVRRALCARRPECPFNVIGDG